MKFLLYDWEALTQKGLIKALEKLGHTVVWYNRKIENHILDEPFIRDLAVKLATDGIDVVISFNFFSQVSLACQAMKKIYLSWIYSCPHYYMETGAAYYEGNFFFVFDRNYANYFIQKGFPNVYHLPLAVDPEVFEHTEPLDRRYGYDVSFVGSLYANEKNYFDQIMGLSDFWKGYVDGLCEAQSKIYGYDLIRANLNQELVQELKRLVKFDVEKDMTLGFEEFLIGIIQKKVTIMERSRYLDALSKQYETALFTKLSNPNEADALKDIILCKQVKYYEEMPEVFRQSKINLNISLRSITSGIPLRVLDIMGCGGFLLTNYQEEIAECFEDRKDLVMWGSQEELIDLCGYYLTHEEERKQIARNGYEKVCRDFSYDVQVQKMLRVISE